MNKFEYDGPFKGDLQSHIELKQAMGYKYESEARQLKRFDQFTLQKYPLAASLSREIVLDWCSRQPHETQANQCTRASILRQFRVSIF